LSFAASPFRDACGVCHSHRGTVFFPVTPGIPLSIEGYSAAVNGVTSLITAAIPPSMGLIIYGS
jgi:hypothetical protein